MTGSVSDYRAFALGLRHGGVVGGGWGIGLGTIIALHSFAGRRLVINLLNTLMGLPPVVVGLVLYLLLSRSGPLGPLSLLFTPTAMVAAQTILATPIVAALTISALLGSTAVCGIRQFPWGPPPASRKDSAAGSSLCLDGRGNRRVRQGERRGGAVMMVGGNIAGYTGCDQRPSFWKPPKGNSPWPLPWAWF